LEIYKKRVPFKRFIELEWMQNNALNYLKNSRPNDYSFVGITELYQKSISELKNKFFMGSTFNTPFLNKGDYRTRPPIDKKLKEAILDINRKEYLWYQEAVENLHP
jgi:hypothetical protein